MKLAELRSTAQRVDELEDMITGLCAYVAFLAEKQAAPNMAPSEVPHRIRSYLSDKRRLLDSGAEAGYFAGVAISRIEELRRELRT